MPYGRRARLSSALVALVTAAALLAPFLAAPAGAAGTCTSVVDRAAWTSILTPRFPSGGAAMTGYALAAYAPDNLYATNGKVVMRSNDGGCNWAPTYRLPAVPGPDGTFTKESASIVQIVVPESPGTTQRVLLVIEENLLGAPRPHVVRSNDGGRTWASGDTGLPLQGHPVALAAGSSNPDVAYLGVDVGGGAIDVVFASSDGGASWIARSDVSKGSLPPGIAGLAVDNLDANSVWAWGSHGLFHSTNGGRSFATIRPFAGTSVPSADVFHASGRPARIIAYHGARRQFLRSSDGGEDWGSIEGPAPDSIAHGSGVDEILMTSGGDAFVFYTPTNTWINIHAPNAGATDAAADRTVDLQFYVRTASTIDVYEGRTGAGAVGRGPLPDELIDVPALLNPVDLKTRPAKLTPARTELRIRAATTKRVHYRLDMPPTPVPVDVYFLVDTGESMQKEINGLKYALGDIQRGLIAAKMDARFGLAQMRSYPDSFPPRSEEDERSFVLRQELDVTGDMARLEAEIEDLFTEGGGQYDAQLGALWHTATGAGADLYPPGPLGHDVPPGLDATWRDQTGDRGVRVIIMATDEPFGGVGDNPNRPPVGDGKLPEPPDIPTFDEAVGALNDRGIKTVGISSRDPSNTDTVTKHLQTVAAGTGSVASSDGVDCDGGGGIDIAPGSPLVCEVQESAIEDGKHVSSAVVNLVRAVATKSEVTLDIERADGTLRSVTPERYPGVVLQSSNTLGFDVDFHCPRSFKSTRRDVTVTARSGGVPLASATAKVTCVGLKESPDRVLSLFEAALVGLVPAVPPAPPPPVTNANATQSQSQAQSQAQAQAQGAAAKQEEEQPQVAFAAAYDAWQEQLASEHLMVAHERKPPWATAPSLVLGAGAVGLMFVYGCALAIRSSVAHAGPSRRRRKG